ncbi:tetratricopeptide repeat protein [Nonomuraea dietziae]|uniref:tetratricopeptide repeat protein n=1 Tax=Nonomuraea dietziae TaxID=65515 RepID=UPI0031DA0FDB
MRQGRAELRQVADELAWKYDRGFRLSDEELDALVEASFRLGVHPDTPPAEAIALLRRAHHLDVDNPKHAYHLGRLYLAHERFEQAALWLELAARLAPGSHRVWAHLSVLERWLDLREKGQQGYTGARRERAAHIGADLTSEESRWSGIHDLEAEARLRGDTSGRTRDALTAELELLAGMAAHRTGGAAAFVVLAVQWIVYGYPAATVRRLAAHLDEGAARDLLELVCDLVESDEAELPGALAAALAGGELPGVLVALLHQRRLLRRPLRFPDLGAHAAARRFEGGDPDAVVKALDRATARLTAEPPAHLGEATAKQAVQQQEVGDPRQRLDAVLAVAERLEQARNGVKALIGKRARQKPSDAETYSLLTGDVETLTEVLGRIESRAEAALTELRGLKQALPAAEFGQLLQNGENQLTDVIGPLGGVRGTLTKKVGKKCVAVAEQFPAAAPIPSAEALDLLALLPPWQQPTSVLPPEAVAAPESVETRETPQTPESPMAFADDPVRAALARADDALRATFDRAAATLDAYSGPALRAGPVAMLRDYVEGTRAEALYRTGRGGQARAVWNQMLARNPLDLALLRNLAVAHTCAGDVAHATAAWRAYLVAHYLLDLAEGAPYGHAVRRAELHELLTRGFGTACLRRKPPGPEEDLDSVPLALASRAKTVAVAAHLRLEALNRIICHRDPAIVLGLDRSAGAEQVRAARERRLAFVERACAELPGSAGARLRRAVRESRRGGRRQGTGPLPRRQRGARRPPGVGQGAAAAQGPHQGGRLPRRRGLALHRVLRRRDRQPAPARRGRPRPRRRLRPARRPAGRSRHGAPPVPAGLRRDRRPGPRPGRDQGARAPAHGRRRGAGQAVPAHRQVVGAQRAARRLPAAARLARRGLQGGGLVGAAGAGRGGGGAGRGRQARGRGGRRRDDQMGHQAPWRHGPCPHAGQAPHGSRALLRGGRGAEEGSPGGLQRGGPPRGRLRLRQARSRQRALRRGRRAAEGPGGRRDRRPARQGVAARRLRPMDPVRAGQGQCGRHHPRPVALDGRGDRRGTPQARRLRRRTAAQRARGRADGAGRGVALDQKGRPRQPPRAGAGGPGAVRQGAGDQAADVAGVRPAAQGARRRAEGGGAPVPGGGHGLRRPFGRRSGPRQDRGDPVQAEVSESPLRTASGSPARCRAGRRSRA